MLFNLFSFSGRIGRLQYLLSSLLALVVVSVPVIGLMILTVPGHGLAAALMPLGIGMLVMSACMLAITAKRLHDLDLSGWHAVWILALNGAPRALDSHSGFIAIFCWIFSGLMSLFLLLAPGSSGPNSFDGGQVMAPPRARPGSDPIARLNFGK